MKTLKIVNFTPKPQLLLPGDGFVLARPTPLSFHCYNISLFHLATHPQTAIRLTPLLQMRAGSPAVHYKDTEKKFCFESAKITVNF